jgi:phenylacetic acid degradation operon negative regulatory protein
MPQPLERIIDQLKREPSRTGSIVITVFGDAIVPRGGSVWLGTLLDFFAFLDSEGGVVRGLPPTAGSSATRSAATASTA